MVIAIDGEKRTFSYKCDCCGIVHEGAPSFANDEPFQAFAVPEKEKASRVKLNSDLCVLDDEHYYIRATLEVPINETDDGFLWGVWV